MHYVIYWAIAQWNYYHNGTKNVIANQLETIPQQIGKLAIKVHEMQDI